MNPLHVFLLLGWLAALPGQNAGSVPDSEIASIDVPVNYQALLEARKRPSPIAINVLGRGHLVELFEYRLREEARGSKGLALQDRGENAIFVLSIQTLVVLPDADEDQALAIAYRVTTNWSVLGHKLLLKDGLIVAPKDDLAKAAQSIVAAIDAAVVDWQKSPSLTPK